MFGRLLTAMVTPMNEDGSINYELAAKLAAHLVENGCDALVVAGSTGEAATLTDEEDILLFETVVNAVKGKAKIIGGTGTNDTQHSIELTRMCEKIGLDGVMLTGPYYNKPTQEGYYRHFKAIAESTKLPVLLYNVPGRTSGNILPPTVARLAEIPNIVGIKEACGNMGQVIELLSVIPKDFVVYSGDDDMTVSMMAHSPQVQGVISVVGNIAPRQMKELVTLAADGKFAQAGELQVKLHKLVQAMFFVTNPIPVKAAAAMLPPLNGQGGTLRLPLVSLNEKETEHLRSIMKEYNLI